jgi:toxin-antitoxin system PIN domain toxin
MYLPDINFWLALAFDQHKHSAAAVAWYNALAGRVCHFCRYTQLGLLRLSTNPKSNPLQTANMTEAWAVYDKLRNLPGVGFLTEPDGLETHWRAFSQGAGYSHHVWNDAYLAAFALATG